MNLISLETPKYLIGLETRTKNSDEMAGHGKIPWLWQEFFKKNIPFLVKDKSQENAYGVYSQYESDHTGEYDYFIGFEVKDPAAYEGKTGVVIKKILAGKYSCIISENGPVPTVTAQAWLKIWEMTDKELGGKRLFKTDYEIYPLADGPSEESRVNIFVGINAV